MKKLLQFFVASILLVGCTQTKTTDDTATKEAEASKTVEQSETSDVSKTQVGLASVTSVTSQDATSDKDGQAKTSTLITALVLEEGKIAYLSIDTAQNSVDFNESGEITSEKQENYLTKKELKDDYGMKVASSIGKEWFEQIDALETYAVGKTVSELLSVAVDEQTKVTDDELQTQVTIRIGDILKAIEKASQQLVSVDDISKVGIASTTSIDRKNATSDKDGEIAFTTMYALTALDASDKISLLSYDVVQSKATFDATGKVTDSPTSVETKKEKGDAYGMKVASSIGKEWFEQAQALENYAVGKTVSEFLSTAIDEQTKVTDEDLKTQVTMSIGALLQVFEKATSQLSTLN